ncbi:TenA family protein [Acuticoccus sp. I52.16.1]|uniref:TenA family protein n=1 Tax=Acuticoccus sp. I52.16.1 TaxID=2928472 RepID=UPI001FD20E95|nr:TenA family protein [Acuticoccus sp. I52.16.1]UOM35974.1 TenA family protein [Acuticoccus sp. I52.16.1]
MSFSATAWARNEVAYETIRTMPFNAELAEGTLPRSTFEHYIVQDAHYLIGFGRALAIAAAKAPHPDRIVQFTDAAKEAIVVERALHGAFLEEWGIDAATFADMHVSPACHHYVSYLIATAFAEPYEILLAALLPCFWIYAEVGRDIHARAAPDNAYRKWIDTYADEAFHQAVIGMRTAADEAAEGATSGTRDAMLSAYNAAMQLEYIFWDSAYHRRDWPL